MSGLLNLSTEDAEEYSQSLAQIGEGWWRQIAWAFRQGVPEALDMSRREWAERYHGYFKLAISERQEAVKELASEGMSNGQIADTLGVSDETVRRDRAGSTNVEEGSREDQDVQVVDEPEQPDTTNVEPANELLLEPPAQLDEGDEWYTPRWLFSALDVKFSIDVCAALDRTYSSVPAERHFSIEVDGLAQHWQGTVWCNPPYSKPEPWARRMIHHGDGLLLTHMPMNAGWCVDVWDACDAIRLFQAMEFVRPDGTSQRPGYWLQLAAFGSAATEALARVQPLGDAAFNKRRIASPMWRRAA